MMPATIASGYPAPVPNTPAAASTARLPRTSLPVHIQAESMLASSAAFYGFSIGSTTRTAAAKFTSKYHGLFLARRS